MDSETFHREISRELGSISVKLESLPKIEKHLQTLNGRTGKLEEWQTKITTKTGVVASVISIVWGIVVVVISIVL